MGEEIKHVYIWYDGVTWPTSTGAQLGPLAGADTAFQRYYLFLSGRSTNGVCPTDNGLSDGPLFYTIDSHLRIRHRTQINVFAMLAQPGKRWARFAHLTETEFFNTVLTRPGVVDPDSDMQLLLTTTIVDGENYNADRKCFGKPIEPKVIP